MGKLFGTDGIRGKANEYPMTPEMGVAVGRAVASFFKHGNGQSKILIGKDTRLSGDMLEHALVAGICAAGSDAVLLGVIPTPAVAYLTAAQQASAGIVISASHNPFYDNGIKLFNQEGFKFADEFEAEIENRILSRKIESATGSIIDTGKVHYVKNPIEAYIRFLKSTIAGTGLEGPLKGLKIVLDCANGATYQSAPILFAKLGADVKALNIQPDGKNINNACGSEYPEILATKVVDSSADIGLAFDGDGDRLTAVDENGNSLTGDTILAVCADFMKNNGTLKNNVVVSTVMSNMGLGVALKKSGIRHSMSKVGDRYVMQEMKASGAVIGGEDSGHMIFLDQHTTGDGILSALRLTEVLQKKKQPLSELRKIMTVFPQVLVNVDVSSKPDIETVPEIRKIINAIENQLGEEGRVLVRYSGTQPLCRVMVEGPTQDTTEDYCRQIADIVSNVLG